MKPGARLLAAAQRQVMSGPAFDGLAQPALADAGEGEPAVMAQDGQIPPVFGDLSAPISEGPPDAGEQRVDVGGRAEPGLTPGLFPERFGQAFLELLDAGVQPDRSWAASRSACSDARVTAGPMVSPVAGGVASSAWIFSSRSRWR